MYPPLTVHIENRTIYIYRKSKPISHDNGNGNQWQRKRSDQESSEQIIYCIIQFGVGRTKHPRHVAFCILYINLKDLISNSHTIHLFFCNILYELEKITMKTKTWCQCYACKIYGYTCTKHWNNIWIYRNDIQYTINR